MDREASTVLKFGKRGQSEPTDWDLQHLESLSAPQNGSLLLVSHRHDANFGDVTITPLGTDIPNQAPVANNDAATVSPTESVIVDVLGNDSDSDGTLVSNTVAVMTQPSQG